ncbi:hypothetical protein, partial [Paenibacillus dendritiformis]|uniref:hypothetical protein n=1 Tax=Paenibacillus dendritiformis TaxID=130049 RepID=UPI00387E02AE
ENNALLQQFNQIRAQIAQIPAFMQDFISPAPSHNLVSTRPYSAAFPSAVFLPLYYLYIPSCPASLRTAYGTASSQLGLS